MPERNRPPRIDSVQFGDRFVVINYLEANNQWSDGGSKAETLVMPLGGLEEEINEILDDLLELMDLYMQNRRNPETTIRGRE